MHPTSRGDRPAARQVRRRDRHGRGLRGSLVPPEIPLHRTRIERFEDLIVLAVSQLEPRWEAELASIAFAVEEIPPDIPDGTDPDPVPLARLEPGQGGPPRPRPQPPADGEDDQPEPAGSHGAGAVSARIVLYRRPLMARADGDEELAELVLDVIVEQFARWLGVDPQTVDPSYPSEE